MPRISYFVPDWEIIPVIAQPKSMACWATVATMLISWKDRMCYSIETVMDDLGQEYRQIYESNSGLYPSQLEDFIRKSGLTIEWPTCGTPESMLSLLESYGPIAIINDEDPSEGFAVHARLVVGIEGDGSNEQTYVRIIDPAGGELYDEAFDVFQNKFEAMASANGWIIQTMHY